MGPADDLGVLLPHEDLEGPSQAVGLLGARLLQHQVAQAAQPRTHGQQLHLDGPLVQVVQQPGGTRHRQAGMRRR